MRSFSVFILVSSLIVGHASLHAQESYGRVVGTVTDPQGANMAGAKITVVESDTKVSRTTLTGNDGSYQVLELPIGNYSVIAEQPGFSKVQTAPQKLLINQSLRIDIAMEIGQVSNTIQVEAAASNIETVVAQLGSSVTQQTIQNLPLNGRNTLDLATLMPGVTPSNLLPGGTAGAGQTFNVAGGRSDSVTFLLDGGINNNLLSNGIVFQPNPDAVSEFHILTSNYGAEFGRNGGGIVSEVIKSGTNQVHGTAYDFLRNQDFNANLFFNNANHVPVPILKRNQFGATVGGPIVLPKLINGRDKLFFFVSYQGQRQVSTTTNQAVTVYTPAELSGDFSHSNASKTGPDRNVVKFLQANPYYQPNAGLAAQGVINPARIDPVAQNYINHGLIPASGTGQIIPSGNAQANSDDLVEKVDYAPNDKDRIYVTLSSGRAPTLSPFASSTSGVPGYASTSAQHRYHGVVDETHIFTPTLINDIKFTAQRNNSLQSVPVGKLPNANALGINTISDNPTGPTNISFASGATVGYSVQGPTSLIDNTYDLSDVLTWTHEKHTFKYGFTVQPYQDNTVYDFYVNGEFFFSGASGIGSGNDRADFLFGLPDEYLQFGAAPSNIRSKYWAGFGQDEWRVLPNLTLTLGLRYEYSSPKSDTQGRTFSLKYGAQSTVFPGAPIGLLFPGDAGAPTGANFPDRNNFAPRFGFAYSPGKKMSIRGGFGVFYDILKGEDNLQFNGQAPFYGFADLFPNSLGGNPAGPLNYLSDPFAATGEPNPFPSRPPSHNLNFAAAGDTPIGGGGVYFVNPHVRTPYVYQYNLSVQRELSNSIVLEANYVGSSSHKLTGLVDTNPIILGTSTRLYGTQPGANPSYYSYLDTFDNVGRAHYNSLEAGLTKHHSSSVLGDTQFQLSYTYGHSIDNESGFRETTSRVPYYDQKKFMASSDYDIRHNLVFSGDWTLPFDQMWQSGPSRLTKGWNLYPIVSYRTGFPLDITAGINRTRTRVGPSGAGDPNLVRANIVTPGVALFDPHNVQVLNGRPGSYYFNPADFATFSNVNANQNTYGTLDRNSFYGPGRINADVSLVKRTALYSERTVMEFHADFFNVFNHAEFNNPNTSINAGTFGQITNTQPGRIIQLALHFEF